MNRGILLLVLVIFFTGVHAPASGQTADYDFRLFNKPGNLTEILVAFAPPGIKLFQRQTVKGETNCLLIQNTLRTIISDPNGKSTLCTGLGKTGGVVGYYTKGLHGAAPYTGFAFLNGAYADVIPPGTNTAWGSMARAVSPNGLIAGMYLAPNNVEETFLTYGTTFTVIQPQLNVGVFEPTGVNDKGTVIGVDVIVTLWGPASFSAMIADGVETTISYPGSLATYVNGINDKGDIVGDYENADYVWHGFIFSSAKQLYFGPIDVPGTASSSLTGITNSDIITGSVQLPGATTSEAIIGYPAPTHAASSN